MFLFSLSLLNVDKIKLFETVLRFLWCVWFLKGGFVLGYGWNKGVLKSILLEG